MFSTRDVGRSATSQTSSLGGPEAPIWEALLEGSREPLGDLILREAGFGLITAPGGAQKGLQKGPILGLKYPYFSPYS